MAFLKLNRICVPLSLDCDLSCRYCYRNAGRIAKVPDFTNLMRSFLAQIDPEKTQAVVASGGEPLLHFEKVQELFSYVPKNQHVKVMTNGLSLTPEIVRVLNDRKVEVWVSHDGDCTKFLRGVDIFEDPEILALVREIEHLTISCVCTNRNPDPYRNFQEIRAVLQRPFFFHANPIFASAWCKNLVDGFDYEAFRDGWLHCVLERLDWENPIKPTYKGVGCNVLPNGDVVGMVEIHHKYGTVLDTAETLIANRKKWGDLRQCNRPDCPIAFHCFGTYRPDVSAHACRIRILQEEVAEVTADA